MTGIEEAGAAYLLMGAAALVAGAWTAHNISKNQSHQNSSSQNSEAPPAEQSKSAEEKSKDLSPADPKPPCAKCDEEEKKKEEEQKAKDAKRMSGKELEKAAKNNGYDSAHKLKDDFGLDSKTDIFRDRDGNMYEGPRQGSGIPQPLGININGPE